MNNKNCSYSIRPTLNYSQWEVWQQKYNRAGRMKEKLVCRCDNINAALVAAKVVVEPALEDPLPSLQGVILDELLNKIDKSEHCSNQASQ